MPWVKIDDHFDEHPKLAAVGPLGWGVWLAGLAYCNRNLTDGFIPHGVAESIGGRWRVWGKAEDGREQVTQIARTTGMRGEDMDTDWVIGLLLESGLWEAVDGGYRVHDYADYQPTRDEVQTDRQQTAERVANWRKRHSNMDGNGVTNAAANAKNNGVGTPAPVPVPVPEARTPEPETRPHGTSRRRDGAAEADTPTQRDAISLAERLRSAIVANKPDARTPSSLNPWANTIRLMIERDNRSPERIAQVIDWCQQDAFWHRNVLSADKLREQFDRLEMDMQDPTRGGVRHEGRNAGHGGSVAPAVAGAAREGRRAAAGNFGGFFVGSTEAELPVPDVQRSASG